MTPTLDRFLDKVEPAQLWECWNWTASLNVTDYGIFKYRKKTWLAHRVAYELTYGSLPPELDHMCANRRCVNPLHLRPLSRSENAIGPRHNAHKKFCKVGHELTVKNVYRDRRGYRTCRVCRRRRLREEYARKSLNPEWRKRETERLRKYPKGIRRAKELGI